MLGLAQEVKECPSQIVSPQVSLDEPKVVATDIPQKHVEKEVPEGQGTLVPANEHAYGQKEVDTHGGKKRKQDAQEHKDHKHHRTGSPLSTPNKAPNSVVLGSSFGYNLVRTYVTKN